MSNPYESNPNRLDYDPSDYDYDPETDMLYSRDESAGCDYTGDGEKVKWNSD